MFGYKCIHSLYAFKCISIVIYLDLAPTWCYHSRFSILLCSPCVFRVIDSQQYPQRDRDINLIPPRD